MSNSIRRTPQRRVLVVDDHDVIRRGVVSILETRPYLSVVALAATGRQAVEAAERTEPDIAIVDYSLPDCDGAQLTRRLKDRDPRLAILIYTMHDREDIVRGVRDAGALGFVLKTQTERHLLAALDAVSLGRYYFPESIAALHQYGPPHSRQSSLTPKEQEIVKLIAMGMRSKEMAGVLKISPKTVETHRAAARTKLKVSGTAGLVRYAIRNGLIGE